jgi:hypothetical protein
MATGGDIIEITFNHPSIGSGTLFPKAGEDSTYNTGGFRSADDDNMIDGAGNMIDKMNRTRWSFEALLSWDANIAQDLEKVVLLASDPVLADWTFTNINGTIYKGKGKPVGDVKGNGNASTFQLKVAGSGVLKQ